MLSIMLLLVGIMIAAIGYLFGMNAGLIVPIAVGIAVTSVWISYWNADKLVLRMTHARVIDHAAAPQLYNLVEELTLASGLPLPTIAIVDDPAPNAFATGRDPQHAVIAFTTGILEKMDREELQGVAAHELAHIANRDTLVSAVAATTAGLLAILADMGSRALLFGGRRSSSSGPEAIIMLVLSLVILILAPLAAVLLRSAISRKREALADATAVQFTRNPKGLRSALEKLESDNTVVAAHSTAVAHLWIESPLDGKSKSLFDTHPPIKDRINILRQMEGLPPEA
jgi:heat shock protein HtpX